MSSLLLELEREASKPCPYFRTSAEWPEFVTIAQKEEMERLSQMRRNIKPCRCKKSRYGLEWHRRRA